MSDDAYVEINRANWDSRVPHHLVGYDFDSFRNDPDHISATVRFDLIRLGDVAGKDVVHLQCHLGHDTISLHRLGARVTGLDFSAPALELARSFAHDIGADAEWVEAEVYSAAEILPAGSFDLVYTGIGALCWIPSVARWAKVVSALLKPGGELFIREGHPVLWSLCEPRSDGLVTIDFAYFETEGEDLVQEFTYVSHDEPLSSPSFVSFNHGLAEIFNALWDAGLEITLFEEHDSVPWNALGDAMEVDEFGEWRLRERPERLAATYTLRAVKKTS